MYLVTFGNTAVDWAKQMICPSGTCGTNWSGSCLSSDSTKIYSMYIYGSTRYLYFVTFNVADGAIVGNRYKSSISCVLQYLLVLNGNYLLALPLCTQKFMLLYNINTNTFTMKQFSGSNIFNIGIEASTGRYIIVGYYSPNGYISKFMPQSIEFHPDFIAGTWTMDVITTGTDDVLTESGATIQAETTEPVVSASKSNVTKTYTLVSSTSSDVSYQASDQLYTIPKITTTQETPDLPCSVSGSTGITFSIADYNGVTAPTWVTIDSSVGTLSITTPLLSSDTVFSFYINSLVSGLTGPVQKLIQITVQTCAVSNCVTCSDSSVSICIACNSGYNLTSGACVAIIPPSSTSAGSSKSSSSSTGSSKSSSSIPAIDIVPELKTSGESASATTQSVICVVVFASSISSFTNASSMASLWAMVNQVQLFFMLLLTNAFIPESIKITITGQTFELNPFESISFIDSSKYKRLIDKFNYNVNNPMLNSFNVESASTFYNCFSFLVILVLIAILHIFVYIAQKKILACREPCRCGILFKFLRFVIIRIFEVLTFGYYIRLVLEINEYMIISSINEIHNFDYSKTALLISLCFAHFVLLSYLILIIFLIIFSLSSYQIASNHHNKLSEFFSGLKSSKKHRLYVAFLVLRRCIFVAVLISFNSSLVIIKTAILTGVQLLYLISMIVRRPFEDTKCNIIEILNELIFLLLLGSLLIYNSEVAWTETVAYIYIWIIGSNTVVVGFIILVDFLKVFCRKMKMKFHKPIQAQTSPIVLEHSPSLEVLENRNHSDENHHTHELHEIFEHDKHHCMSNIKDYGSKNENEEDEKMQEQKNQMVLEDI